MRKKIRRYIFLSLKISIAIFVIFYLFRSGWLTKETFTKLFRTDNVPSIIVSGLFFFAAQVLCTSRLVLLLRAINFPLRFFRAFKLVMIGNFFNTVIPGMVGGDLVKGYYLVKSEEERKGQSAGVIIMDRALGFLALTFIGGTFLAYLLWQKGALLYRYRYESYIALVIFVSVSGLFGAFLAFARNTWVREKIRTLFATIFHKGIFYYLLDGFGALVKRPIILIYCLFVSILIQLCSLTGVLILGSIGSETFPDVIPLAAATVVALLFSVIPVTPGNLGWTELVAAFSWSAVGSNAGATIFLGWRIVTVICSLPGGLVFLFMPDRLK